MLSYVGDGWMCLSFYLSTQTVLDHLRKDWDSPIYVFLTPSLPLSMWSKGNRTSSSAAPLNVTIEVALFVGFLIKAM